MNVVLIGSARVDVHAIARALGRALDAVVLDGDRIIGTIDGEEGWIQALERRLAHPRRRPHAVATCRSAPPTLRRMLHRSEFRLVDVHDDAEALPRADDDEGAIVVHAGGDVEAIATRVAVRLLRG